MDTKKIDAMFAEKKAVELALKALLEVSEEKIKNKLEKILLDLDVAVKEYGFFIVPHGHHDEMRCSVIKDFQLISEIRIEIRDYKIYSASSEKTPDAKVVIELINDFF